MLSALLVFLLPKILHCVLLHLASRIHAPRALPQVLDPNTNLEAMVSSVLGFLPDSNSPCHSRSCAPKGSRNSDLLRKDREIALDRCPQMARTGFQIQFPKRHLFFRKSTRLNSSHL